VPVNDLALRSPNDSRVSEGESGPVNHVILAKIVLDILEQRNVSGKVVGHAGSFMRKIDATLNETSPDFFLKTNAFFQYDKYDAQIEGDHFLVSRGSTHIVIGSEPRRMFQYQPTDNSG
jgi:hypothetical protein